MLSLNQVIARIEKLVKNHAQVNSFYYGSPTAYLKDKTVKYPACMIVDNATPNTLGTEGNVISYGLQMFLLDLVHVASETEDNERDVISDMQQVAADLISQANHDSYQDWKITTASAQPIRDTLPDVCAGVLLNFNIDTIWEQDICAVPLKS